jgi:carbonic anhydrase
MRLLKRLFENNERWAAHMLARDPEFFGRLAAQQAPQFLWIGCSDSRVPANQIIGLLPGEVFVHRNVANVVHPCDMNCLSVLQYAVETLNVGHIIVVGHYGCGGVRQALEEGGAGMIDHWLSPIRQIRRRHREAFDHLPSERSRWDRLCELNVIEQTLSVSQTTILRDAWARGSEIAVHGWIYGLHDGRLRDLEVTVTSIAEADSLQARTASGRFVRDNGVSEYTGP